MEECILCYDPLRVPVYRENTTDDIIVDGDSSRLQCGHAYHTVCLLKSLQHRSVCPLCNVVGQAQDNEEWWQNGRIALEGRCTEIMEKVKKSKEVREAMRDYKAALKDIMDVKKDFSKKVKDFKTGLRADMGVDEKLKTVMKTRASVTRIFHRKAKSEGSLVAGALNLLPTYKIDMFLFGMSRFFRWRMNRVFN